MPVHLFVTSRENFDICVRRGLAAVPDTIVELKRDMLKEDGLSQLLRYEEWFLKKRTASDSRAIRTVAIAHDFHPNVVTYVKKRESPVDPSQDFSSKRVLPIFVLG